MKYTMDDLKKVSKQYEENFEKLEKSEIGSKEHKRYVKEENRLDAKEIKIRAELGLLIPDPCPLTSKNVFCTSCTGFYREIPKLDSKGKLIFLDSKEKITIREQDDKKNIYIPLYKKRIVQVVSNGIPCNKKEIGGLYDRSL